MKAGSKRGVTGGGGGGGSIVRDGSTPPHPQLARKYQLPNSLRFNLVVVGGATARTSHRCFLLQNRPKTGRKILSQKNCAFGLEAAQRCWNAGAACQRRIHILVAVVQTRHRKGRGPVPTPRLRITSVAPTRTPCPAWHMVGRGHWCARTSAATSDWRPPRASFRNSSSGIGWGIIIFIPHSAFGTVTCGYAVVVASNLQTLALPPIPSAMDGLVDAQVCGGVTCCGCFVAFALEVWEFPRAFWDLLVGNLRRPGGG